LTASKNKTSCHCAADKKVACHPPVYSFLMCFHRQVDQPDESRTPRASYSLIVPHSLTASASKNKMSCHCAADVSSPPRYYVHIYIFILTDRHINKTYEQTQTPNASLFDSLEEQNVVPLRCGRKQLTTRRYVHIYMYCHRYEQTREQNAPCLI